MKRSKISELLIVLQFGFFYFAVVVYAREFSRLGTKPGVKTRKQALEKFKIFREIAKVEKNIGQF